MENINNAQEKHINELKTQNAALRKRVGNQRKQLKRLQELYNTYLAVAADGHFRNKYITLQKTYINKYGANKFLELVKDEQS